MNFKFTDWYTQALGATLGIAVCIYSYMQGDMIIYDNIGLFFDIMNFSSIISSYLLLPLCMITLILAIMRSYTSDKAFYNISLESLNIGIIVSTVIIGFIGTKLYFIIPAFLILFHLYNRFNIKSRNQDNYEIQDDYEVIEPTNEDLLEQETKIFKDSKPRCYDTKIEIAKDLLVKNAKKQFISEVSGLTLQEIENLEESLEKGC